MALAPATKLGPYEVVAPLGAGGMGEVYRARDTKLNRDIAIKVLPESFANDPERMARFGREAQVLASLNHTNIAHVYGLEESGDLRALVMELVEGQTLASRIVKGRLPLDEALPIARQIADALEFAHDHGVIHRDLKPANIMIAPHGAVKILDFGLAKALEDLPAVDLSVSPTISMADTRVGVILGTAAYMSPEQASGKPVDKRADIWSFGVVLWEMLTGRRLFQGETLSHTLADVLRGPIDFDKLPSETPLVIQELLRRCLDRDAKSRLRDIGEARVAINNSGKEPAVADAMLLVSRRRRILPWAITTAALTVAGFVWWRSTRPVEHALVQLDVDLGAEISLPAPDFAGSGVILSPDGTRLVYVASVSSGQSSLFTRRLDQPKAISLSGTEGAAGPFFSPDGQWVGFSVGNKLNKISVEGGAIVPLGDIPFFAGASWGENGDIIVGQGLGGMVRIPSGGGAPTTLTELPSGEIAHANPQVLPGGKAVLFAAFKSIDNGSIEVISLGDHRRKTVALGGTSVALGGTSFRYLPSGHLAYLSKGKLFAIPFDLDRLETRGTAVSVLDEAGMQSGITEFDVSRNGTLLIRKGGPSFGTSTVQWLEGTGKTKPLLAKSGVYQELRLSPDGKRLALVVTEGVSQDIWVYDWQHDTMTRLTFDRGGHGDPTWSQDNRYVIFDSYSTSGIFWTRADGSGQPEPLTRSKNFQIPASFTPDGTRLAYHEIASVNVRKIWTVPVEDNGGQLRAGTPEQFLKTQFSEDFLDFSPDGKWLAYTGDESGREEVYVRAFPAPASGQGSKWQISNSGGKVPRWSRNGHELLYFGGNRIMAVNYSVKGETFLPDKPRVWAPKAVPTTRAFGCDNCFDLSPDGKRVAVLMPIETKEGPQQEHEVVFLFNLFDHLRRRAPVGNE